MSSQSLAEYHAGNHTRVREASFSGESLSIQNTVNSAADVTVSGNSTQARTTQGKNLFDVSAVLETNVGNLKFKFSPNIVRGSSYTVRVNGAALSGEIYFKISTSVQGLNDYQ